MNDTMNLIGGPARAFAAGVKAADENPPNPCAEVKLRRLIERIEKYMRSYDKSDGSARFLCTRLREAIEEAKL